MKLNQEISLLLLGLSIQLCNVQSSGFGRCPNYPSMPKFNMSQFLGKWYEIERSFYLPEIASGCTTLLFERSGNVKSNFTINSLPSNDNEIEVTVRSINQWTGSPSSNIGRAIQESDKSSIMDFTFESRLPDVIARFLPGAGRYQVLYTDYNTFAILWSCSSIGSLGYTDQIWLMGRERSDFVVDTRKTIYDALSKLGLDSDRLVLSKNNNC